MNDSKRKRDIISEQTFNSQTLSDLDIPELDSQGDSDEDVEKEYLLGVNYMPDEKNEYEGNDSGEVVPADLRSSSPSEVPSEADFKLDDSLNRVPQSTRVVNSKVSSPLQDQDTDSDLT